jgi:hypothetical protein
MICVGVKEVNGKSVESCDNKMQESGEIARELSDRGCVDGVYVFVHEKVSADAPARGWR